LGDLGLESVDWELKIMGEDGCKREDGLTEEEAEDLSVGGGIGLSSKSWDLKAVTTIPENSWKSRLIGRTVFRGRMIVSRSSKCSSGKSNLSSISQLI
jgi:hypothetical protein